MYRCSYCDFETQVFRDRCPRCSGWGTFKDGPTAFQNLRWDPKPLSRIKKDRVLRVSLHDDVVNRFFGFDVDDPKKTGAVKSCSYLFSGVPGCGKSTWMLQLAQYFEAPLYISGEEAEGAIKKRVERLQIDLGHLRIVETTDLEFVAKNITDEFDLMIFDSAHRFRTAETNAVPGSAIQVAAVMRLASDMARKLATTSFIIGHVNKDGAPSGMTENEHEVDATCLMEGDEGSPIRTARMKKNRHGEPISIRCVMTDRGLHQFEFAA